MYSVQNLNEFQIGDIAKLLQGLEKPVEQIWQTADPKSFKKDQAYLEGGVGAASSLLGFLQGLQKPQGHDA